MDQLRESSVIGGRFRLIGPVGTGGPGAVWRAADLASGQAVAVKTLDAFRAGDTVAQARFRLVARTVAQLSAPGVAPVRESGEAELDGGRTVPYLVRDLVTGPTLVDRLNQGPLPTGEALRLVADVAGALDVAHRAGVAHGHLVPSNIVFGPGLVKITDFGLWPLRPRPAGQVPGGLSYAAPELTDGPATPAADMYALGVVFVACLAGITSDGVSAAGPEAGVLGDAAQDPVPAGLAALWAACLRPHPGERPSAAHAAVMSRQMLPGRDGSAAAAWTGWVPAPRAEPTLTEFAASGPASGEPSSREPSSREPGPREPGPDEPAEKGPGARRPADRTAARPAGRRPFPGPGRGRSRASRGRGRLVTASGATAAVAAVAVVVVGLLASSPEDRSASPASAATATQDRTAVAAGPSRSGRVPSPESTSSVLASSPPSPRASPGALSPLAAIDQLSLTVHADVAGGQIRPDVGVDFGNLIDPVRSDLASGQPAPVAQLAGELRAKLWTRVSEGAVTVTAATVLNSELTALANSAG